MSGTLVRTKSFLVAVFALALVAGACGNGPSQTPSPTLSTAATSSAIPSPSTSATPTASPSASDSASASASASDSGSPSASASSSPSASASASTSTGPSGSSSVGPSPSGSGAACAVEAPTTLSGSWATLDSHDMDFAFKFPGNWDKLFGAFVFTTSSLLDPQTFAETGLP